MNEQSKTQEPSNSQQPSNRPVEPVDLAIAHLTAIIQSLEDKRDKATDEATDEAQIPADIPRFLTHG